MSLKQKTISGLLWSFAENFSQQGIVFIFGIIMARILTPREFGLTGMVVIFIALSKSIIDSGFTQALIRKKNCTQADYSTVFYFNLAIGLFLFIILFLCAESISRFYNEPILRPIVQALALGLIINSFSIVQRAQLTKRLDFKLQTKISVIASLSSGIIGIVLAYNGFGVWSLVIKGLIGLTITSILLWIWNKWKPSLVFSLGSFKEMFSFGYKLLISGLIDTVYRNIYLIIIGKYFSAAELGFYNRADQFNNLASSNITWIIQRVSYPVLSEIQDDIPKLKSAYQKIIKSTMLVTFTMMFGMAAVAEPMVIALIGEKWLPSVSYLQLLCFVGMLYPLHAINLNMLIVQGRSNLFLRLEIIKKMLAIPVIIVAVFLGIKMMIIGMILLSLVAYFLNSYYSGRQIGYSSFQQIKDILPSLLLASSMGLVVYLIGIHLSISYQMILIIQIIAGIIYTIGIAELLKLDTYIYVKNTIQDKFSQLRA